MAVYMATLKVLVYASERPDNATVIEHVRDHLSRYPCGDITDDVASVEFVATDTSDDPCPACKNRGWLVVDVNSTGNLRIESCDMCHIMNDGEAAAIPDAIEALSMAQSASRK